MFIKRDISGVIEEGARQVPVIAIVGPRQSGKSTLARELFPNHTYIDMQDAQLVSFAQNDPKGFLETYKNKDGIIIDEAQYAPNLFPQIKVEADRNPTPGFYVLSGSQNFLLHEKISESLAGRVYFYVLLPLSIKELKQANLFIDDVEKQMFKGFYPRVYQKQINPLTYYENYIATYVERDIRSITNVENILAFNKCMQLCALRIGTTINYTEIATSCEVSIPTIKRWIGLLQTSYVLFQLPPYFSNFGKRVVKSPKLYFYDVGLATTLMNVDRDMIVKKRDLYGALFENMVIVDLMKNYNAQGLRPNLSFFRDTNQNEVDLIIELRGKTTSVEIKATETVLSKFFKTPAWFQREINSSEQPIIVFSGAQLQKRSMGMVVPWSDLARLV